MYPIMSRVTVDELRTVPLAQYAFGISQELSTSYDFIIKVIRIR